MPLTEQEVQTLSKSIGDQLATKMATEITDSEKRLNQGFADMQKGLVTNEAFEAMKKEAVDQAQKAADMLAKLEGILTKQGDAIDVLKDAAPGSMHGKSMKDFMAEQVPKLQELKKNGVGTIEFTLDQLKAAGITSIAGTVVPGSPYLPGISDTPLELFDIVRNANFMINRVDVASTNQPVLAWINETGFDGTINMNIPEGELKSLIQHTFNVETSRPKKAAAYMRITDEFATDVEQLYNDLQGLLQTDVIRAFDDQIQYDVFNQAIPWNLSGLVDEIQDANLWDAAYALLTQPGVYNFDPNTIAWNWMSNAKVNMGKDNTAAYLLPPFAPEINRLLVRANKIPTNSAIAGDLKQYRVRILKDYTFKMGWINDDFIRNQFAILGEIRYHSFISQNRRYAIAKGDLNSIRTQIDGTPGS